MSVEDIYSVVRHEIQELLDQCDEALAKCDEARRWARRIYHVLAEYQKLAFRMGYLLERSETENAALRRELEALKRRLPVWFDVGHNETDQQPDGFPP